MTNTSEYASTMLGKSITHLIEEGAKFDVLVNTQPAWLLYADTG